jgi:glycosyltransferase involved in cell wall biosynthesis
MGNGAMTRERQSEDSRRSRTDGRVNVLAVIDGYRLSGPARQLLDLRHCAGVVINMAVFQRQPDPTPLILAAREVNVPTRVVPDRFPGDPRTVVAFARLAADAGTDILQTHGYKANVLAALVRPQIRRPWIAFMHGETWENWKVRAYFALERVAVRRADCIVAVSHQMARALEAQGIPSGRLRVIHNACLVTPRPDAPPAAWNADAPPIVGVVGRLSHEKGVDIALSAHRLMTRGCPAARLWVLGEGPEREPLMRLAERLGIASSVEWLGYREDPEHLYRRMAVLLIPSRSEGLPNVALEAMAHGIPVVATAVGGVPEVVSDGQTGFLVPREDAEGLASRVLTLLKDATLRRTFGHAARAEVAVRFSPESRRRALARLYAEVCA